MSHRPWTVTRMGGYNTRVRCEEGMTEADARLIASAPDLLAALERIAKEPHRGMTIRVDAENMRSYARAAIAKAKGIEP